MYGAKVSLVVCPLTQGLKAVGVRVWCAILTVVVGSFLLLRAWEQQRTAGICVVLEGANNNKILPSIFPFRERTYYATQPSYLGPLEPAVQATIGRGGKARCLRQKADMRKPRA